LELSLVGLLVCCALLAFGFFLGSPIIIALFASLPFGATAFITLTGLGGSSPLIYTAFVLMLVLAIALRPGSIHKIGTSFGRHWLPWLILALVIYVVGSALIFPQLFAGQAMAFVPIQGVVTELPLVSVSGNITQPAYFALGALCFFSFYAFLRKPAGIAVVGTGFLVFAAVQVTLGAIDFGSKLTGLGDVLAPLRTANYAMLTDTQAFGFWRITGGYSEASAFAGTSVACLAFVFTYWRATGSRVALVLTLALLGLLLMSTSSVAYVALALLTLFVSTKVLFSFLANRLTGRDIEIIVLITVGLTLIFVVYLANEKLLDPFAILLDEMVFEKLSSSSGVERTYWNTKSLESLTDTYWLGVGMGSSRSSSWVISVLSQLGIIGASMMGILVAYLLRGTKGLEGTSDRKRLYIANGVCAAALASLLTSSIAGSGADPGLIFFISLAVLVSCREQVRAEQERINWRFARNLMKYPRPTAAEGTAT
jgi:hypothetical protein